MLHRLLLNIGYEERPVENDFTKYLREEAIKWACILDVLECRKTATSQLEKDLSSSVQDKYVVLQYMYIKILWHNDMTG